MLAVATPLKFVSSIVGDPIVVCPLPAIALLLAHSVIAALVASSVEAPLANAVIKNQMKGFAQRFIVGRDAADATGALRHLRREGMGFTLDVLGIPRSQSRRRVLNMLKMVGLEHKADAYPPKLSGG